MTACRVLLDGLARDADIFELVSELAPLHPRDNTFPGGVCCEATVADIGGRSLRGVAGMIAFPNVSAREHN